MKKIKFGWDYWNYSRQPEIREIIKKDFGGFSPDYTWQNDSDTLPLFNSNHQPTNAWHNIVPIFDHHIKNSEVTHKDVTDYIDDDESFVYVISTNGGPQLWCGEDSERNTLFHNIKEHTKEHIRKGKVLVVIDLSFEGFCIDSSDKYSRTEMGGYPHLAEVVHRRAEKEKFPIENIAFLSGNHKDPKTYKKWCEDNNIKKSMNWILLDWCERAISSDYKHIPNTFEENFNYKKDNLDNMKHYLCLMRRWKPTRVYHHLALNYHNILDKGSVSAILAKWDVKSIFKDIDRTKLEMNNAGDVTFSDCATEDDTEFNRTLLKEDEVLDIVTEEFYQRMRPDLSMIGTSSETYKIRTKDNIKSFLQKLPLVVDKTSFNTLDSFHHWDSQLYKDTFFSFVYETWSISPNIVFYSEKIYKCILNFHPFVAWANPHTIKYMNDNGYKSFNPHINEDYDNHVSAEDRSILAMKEMVTLCDMTNTQLLDWYANQEEILTHNYNRFMEEDSFMKSVNQFLEVYDRVVE